MGKEQTHRQFILFIAFFQVVVIALFCIFVRYDAPLDSLHNANRTSSTKDSVMDSQYHSKVFISKLHQIRFTLLLRPLKNIQFFKAQNYFQYLHALFCFPRSSLSRVVVPGVDAALAPFNPIA